MGLVAEFVVGVVANRVVERVAENYVKVKTSRKRRQKKTLKTLNRNCVETVEDEDEQ